MLQLDYLDDLGHFLHICYNLDQAHFMFDLKIISVKCCEMQILIDFSLIVKVATLIFISGRGSAFSSAKEGKSDFKELISFLGRANVRAFHENPNRIHTELTFINP